ncbi:MAG TPA: alanine--tRNA ligase [Spirochaetota bacterium]|jgi:alanyl-tRNA synthetase|nr:MAG: Alanine--tRNA ligase [Spirochaetes bacterium ADurb.Bin133]HNZ28173.1 alanine--tRNA ligase [Spirochaetota bacterium]HPY89009.1 alanine--tRNA ligase [Spirochaetota bacterium]
MNFIDLRYKYVNFFKSKGHSHIASASLIPENDPTVLFTTAGMHPLVPYLLGEKHPEGKRLVNWQKCIRTGDIDDVGDAAHLTFFEMLGNWSLGDYFKKEAINWSYEFLIKELGFDQDSLHITVFEGDKDAPRDEESASYWKKLGISADRIHYKPKKDNWWGPAGITGPCGPDTEMFIDVGKNKCSDACAPGCGCGKYIEIWNDVFMEYNKTENGEYIPLKQKNVDTGMGIERTVAMINGKNNVYETDIFVPIIKKIEELSGTSYQKDGDTTKSMRIIADHVRTSLFIIGDDRGISPSNLGAGYVLRRLIRRAVRHGKKLNIQSPFMSKIATVVIEMMKDIYPELKRNETRIFAELEKEERKFEETLGKGMAELEKILPKLSQNNQDTISGRLAFKLYDTYGFPFEFTKELASEKGFKVDEAGFNEAFAKHKELSQAAQTQNFKGGLADHAEATTKLHTATHLLHRALKNILGEHVNQKGSNITAERLRFDFTHTDKIDGETLKKVEDMVNEQIQRKLEVKMEIMSLEEAKKSGATALFGEKYESQVKVYTIGDFSKEVCGGPHVDNAGTLGKFKIVKEQSSSAGVRRIKAVLEN